MIRWPLLFSLKEYAQMADQPARLEAATIKAEIGSGIVYRFSNDAATEDNIPTLSGEIPNLKKVILRIQNDGSEKISFATKIFISTAAGIAGTSNQEIFLVQSSEPGEIYEVWQNVSGTAVDTGKRSISAAAVIEATEAATAAAASAQESADLATVRVARFLNASATPPVSRDDGQPLQAGDQYQNTSDGLNYSWSGTEWVALNQSVTGLTEDLSSQTKGATIVARSLVTVQDVRGINAIPVDNGLTIALRSYAPTAPNDTVASNAKGGGLLYYIASIPKSAHNGGTVFSPTCAWDGLSTTHAAYLAKTGETDPNGLGCWCRLESGDVNIEWFGGNGNNSTDNQPMFAQAMKLRRPIYLPVGTYLTSPVTLTSDMLGCGIRGDGFSHYFDTRPTVVSPIAAQAHIFSIANGCDNFTFKDLRLDGKALANINVDASYGAFLTYDNVGNYRSLLFGHKGRQGETKVNKVFSGGHAKVGYEIYSDASITDSAFSNGTEPLRLIAGGNRISDTWVNSGSVSCLTVEPLDASTTLINTAITNLYIGETYAGAALAPIILLKGLPTQKIQQLQLTNSHIVSADGQASKRNIAIKMSYVLDAAISNLAVLGASPQTAATMLENVIVADNCSNINVVGGVFRNIGKNVVILNEACYGFKMDGVTVTGWGAQVATGTEGAAILINDTNNYGSINNNSFDNASDSTVPYPMQGGSDTRFTFNDNFVRVNNPNYWVPTIGKPRFCNVAVLGYARDICSSLSTGGSAWNQTSGGAPLTIGVYQLWVDANGRLRIKGGAPTSDTDGTIVGTQA